MDDDQFYKLYAGNKEQKSTEIKDEIDPQHVMDDVQSNFTHQVSTDEKSQTSSMFKPKMTKKDLAAFMKEKLGQTKISSSVTTQVSAIGPPKTNFTKPVKPPQKPPVIRRKVESESDEEDWAKANQMLSR